MTIQDISIYSHSVFNTNSKGNSFKDSSTILIQRSKESRECLYGQIHFFRACYYYNPEIRPSRWKANEEIQWKVDENLKKSHIKAFIKISIQKEREIRKEKKEKGKDNTTHHTAHIFHTSTSTSNQSISLYWSWILNSGANIHIINHCKGFNLIRPGRTDKYIGGSKDSYLIKAVDTASVNLTTSSENIILILLKPPIYQDLILI